MKRESQLVNMFAFAYIFYVFLFEIGNCVKVTDFTTIEVTIDARDHAHITSSLKGEGEHHMMTFDKVVSVFTMINFTKNAENHKRLAKSKELSLA